MTPSSRPCLLTDLSWTEVTEHLARDRRLIVPVGACDQYGPHLPIGSGTRIAEAVAARLASEFDVLRAPALEYGVNVPSARAFAGAASLREKTLHRVLNDLLSSWENHGFEEFILITAQSFEPQVEAISTASATRARVRVLDILGIDFSELLGGRRGPQHGGEIVTSLMLYLHPGKVNLGRARDFVLPGQARGAPPRSISRIPAESSGSVGQPGAASAETGGRIFHLIVEKIRAKVFLTRPPEP